MESLKVALLLIWCGVGGTVIWFLRVLHRQIYQPTSMGTLITTDDIDALWTKVQELETKFKDVIAAVKGE